MHFVQTFIPVTNEGNKATYILTQMFEKGYVFQVNDKQVQPAYPTQSQFKSSMGPGNTGWEDEGSELWFTDLSACA